MSMNEKLFEKATKNFQEGYYEGKRSVRKWEKFSNEELVTIQAAVNAHLDWASSVIPLNLNDEIVKEQNFRLALKVAEGESVENLELEFIARYTNSDSEQARKRAETLRKMTDPSGEAELLEDKIACNCDLWRGSGYKYHSPSCATMQRS